MRRNASPSASPPPLPPAGQMDEPARRLRETYAITPDAPLIQREFGFYCLHRWPEQGLDENADLAAEFGYDRSGDHGLGGLGWCEAAFDPPFEEAVLERRGDHELVRDFAGRHVLCFAGRRNGFMPEYVDHPVKDMATWVEHCKWRMDPDSPGRWEGFEETMARARDAAARGYMIVQRCVGGYMYLRSLIGPEDLLYAFYDMPEVIHDCMRTWLTLADAVLARHQQHVTIDELFLAEDLCYNHGLLISPEMMREFLFPYYQQLRDNLRARQADASRRLFLHVDTDGFANPAIDVYREHLGLDVMSPFEVAAGCDVVAIGQAWPDLVIKGGIDKRVLAQGPDAIDRMVERILPAMRRRGGYVPTCDHGVPEEVSLADYRHYRKRCLELGA